MSWHRFMTYERRRTRIHRSGTIGVNIIRACAMRTIRSQICRRFFLYLDLCVWACCYTDSDTGWTSSRGHGEVIQGSWRGHLIKQTYSINAWYFLNLFSMFPICLRDEDRVPVTISEALCFHKHVSRCKNRNEALLQRHNSLVGQSELQT